LLLLAIASLGCGSSGHNAKDRVFVKGKVTLANRPLPSGILVFTGAHDWTVQARIRRNGSYSISDAPVGEVKVGVQGIPRPPGKAGQSVKFMDVPPRYKDPETSGLTFMVTAGGGEQEINIALTP
jgi:hypothetical protein